MNTLLGVPVFLALLSPQVPDAPPTKPDSAAFNASSYTRTVGLPPVHMSQLELEQVIQRLRALIRQANQGVPLEFTTDTLTLSGPNVTLEIDVTRGALSDSFSRFPRPTLSVTYYYRTGASAAPIRTVTLRLEDFSRQLSVNGTAEEQVDAVVALVTNDLRDARAYFGGLAFRALGGAVLLVAGILIGGMWSARNATSTTWLESLSERE
jgi:hypothetical protein